MVARHYLTVVGAVIGLVFGHIAADQIPSPIDDVNALTFTWYDGVTPEKVNIATADRMTHHLAGESPLYTELNGTYKLGATNFSSQFPDSIAWTRSAGFVDTLYYGYRQHHNVIIRPDDIWTAILVQFSLYVNANAEALRSSFVNFEGKKQLVVSFRQPVNKVDIAEFISKMNKLIVENIDQSRYDWIEPTFTTTTENDRLTAGVVMMSTLQEYFDYELFSVICGIPKATILGTVEDWKDIRQRVNKLKEFELEGKTIMAQWSTMLGRILDEFVSVKSGKAPDVTFWKDAIRVDFRIIDMVCARMNETNLNGWMTTFTPFTLSGRWRGDETLVVNQNGTTLLPWLKIRTDKITPGIVHVPIKIYDEFAKESERNYTGAIMAGHVGYSVKRDENTIQPFSGWLMMITNKAPEYMSKKNEFNFVETENK